MTNFLVTGGCGFIGSNFTRYLLDRWDGSCVVNLDSLSYAGNRANLTDVEAAYGGTRYFFVHGDIRDGELVRSLFDGSLIEGNITHRSLVPDIVVNFAAETHVDRSINSSLSFSQTNVLGANNLLEAARSNWCVARNKRAETGKAEPKRIFLHVSTDEVYGRLGEEGSFTEASPLRPNNPYAASKASADLLVRAYHQTYGLPAIITRSSNNYGPYQYPEKFIPLITGRALADRPLPLYGDGRNVREWLYVEDHCKAIMTVLVRGTAGRIYNIGSGVEKRNLEVAKQVLHLLGKPESLISFIQDRPGHDWRYSLDCGPISRLGWKPRVPFEEGIKRTIEWYVEHPEWLQGSLDLVMT